MDGYKNTRAIYHLRDLKIEELSHDLSTLRVAVVGIPCLDINGVGKWRGYSRELESVPRFLTTEDTVRPGGPGNLAHCFATIGSTVYVVGTIGTPDMYSRELLLQLRDYGIRTEYLIEYGATPLFGKYYWPSGHLVSRVDRASSPLDDDTINKVALNLNTVSKIVDLIIFADYDECGNELCQRLIGTHHISKFRGNGSVKIVATSRTLIRSFYLADYTVSSREEIIEQLECRFDTLSSAELWTSLGSNGTKVVTMGGVGCAAYHMNGVLPSAVCPIEEEVDTCGCGDAFLTLFSSAIALTYPLHTALALGNMAGRAAARKLYGADAPTLGDIEREIVRYRKEHPEELEG